MEWLTERLTGTETDMGETPADFTLGVEVTRTEGGERRIRWAYRDGDVRVFGVDEQAVVTSVKQS